ncbi:hypothetical protein LWI29_030863 [Acer saccharum]|uniref:Uncharacterized protein n=1 Tax=Acer saccharum TaxID=4024 RepID=A0AA39T1N3_ACESA|nr:hypothetical protein LWI29_030863 [Acer saccharum]
MVLSKRKTVSNKPFEVEKHSFLTVTRSDTEFVTDIKGVQEVYALVVKALVAEGEKTLAHQLPAIYMAVFGPNIYESYYGDDKDGRRQRQRQRQQLRQPVENGVQHDKAAEAETDIDPAISLSKF